MNVDFNNTKAQEIFKDFSSSKTVGYIRQNSDNYKFTAQLTNDKFDYSKDDGKISAKDKLINFGKGIITPFTYMFKSPKNFIMSIGAIAGVTALTIATGGAIAPLLVTTGVVGGSIQLGRSIYKAHNAKTDSEAKQAWQGIGTGTSAIVGSIAGAKSAAKGAKIQGAEKMNPFQATWACIKNSPKAIKNSFGILRTKCGQIIANLKIKNQTPQEAQQPKTEAQQPNTEAQQPKSEAQQPKTEAQQSKSEAQQPKQEVQQPKSEAQQPKTEAQQPNTEAQQPKTEAQQPKQEAQQPKQEVQQPKQEAQQPKQEAQQPKSEAQQPKSEVQQPKQKAQSSSSKQQQTRAEQHEKLLQEMGVTEKFQDFQSDLLSESLIQDKRSGEAYIELVQKLMKKHNISQEEYDNLILEIMRKTKMDGTDTSLFDYVFSEIQDVQLDKGTTLYHGTTADAKTAILKNGYDIQKQVHFESGKGIYTVANRELLINPENGQLGYGDGSTILQVILQRSGKYAQIPQSGVSRIMQAQIIITDKILNSGVSSELVMDVIIKHLKQLGYDGVITKTQNAHVPYTVIWDPSTVTYA